MDKISDQLKTEQPITDMPADTEAITSSGIKSPPNKKKMVIVSVIVFGLVVLGLGGWGIYRIVTAEPEDQISENDNDDESNSNNSGGSMNNSSGNGSSSGAGTNSQISGAETIISELFNFTKSELKRRNISVDSSIVYKQIDNTPLLPWQDIGIATAYRPTGFNFNVVPEKSFMYRFSDIPGWGRFSYGIPVSETERQHLEEIKRKISSMGLTNLGTSVPSYNKEQYGKGTTICHITASFARCAEKSWFNAKDYPPFIEAAKERWGDDFIIGKYSYAKFFGKIVQSDSPIKPFQRAILGNEHYFWRADSSSKWVMLEGSFIFDGYCSSFSSEGSRKAFFGTPCYGENGETTVGAS